MSEFKKPGTAPEFDTEEGLSLALGYVDEIRGYYETNDEGLDEVFHRAQHVRKEARQTGS